MAHSPLSIVEEFPHMVVNAYEVPAPPSLHPELPALRWWPGPCTFAEAERDTFALLAKWNAGTLIQRNKPYSLDLHGCGFASVLPPDHPPLFSHREMSR